MIQLVVFETYPLYNIGIQEAFKGSCHIHVAVNTSDPVALFPLLEDTLAEVVLLGVNSCDSHLCVDVARHIRRDYPLLKILAFANEDTEQPIQLMMEAGINGFIGKRQADRLELEKAILQVAAGEEYIGRIDNNTNLFAKTRHCEKILE